MNFFKIKTTWTNAELIPLKICIASAYLIVGAYFHNFVREYFTSIVIVFTLTVVFSVFKWLQKMKSN